MNEIKENWIEGKEGDAKNVRVRIIARKGIFALGDTNRGYMILFEDSEKTKKRGKVYLTEGWIVVGQELIGRRLIIRGDEPFKSKVCGILNFLERDGRWKDTFVCWQGLSSIVDLLIMRLISVYEIVSVRKK